jgi:hypothetical protein
MGVIKRGILGGFSGSVGNVVGSSWKGIAVIKSKPLSVANPDTAAQQVQRGAMTNVVAFAKEILVDIIKPLCDRFASGMSGFNLFTQRNIALFDAVAPSPVASLILAQGPVTDLYLLVATVDVSLATAKCVWNNNTGVGDALASDECYIVVYNETLNTFALITGFTRISAEGTAVIPAGTAVGNVIRIWGSFRRADGTKVSNTVYATVNAIA